MCIRDSKRGHTLVSGGTDNHVLLLDLCNSDLTGKDLEHRLDEVYITVNKNTVPNEPRSPFVTSGIRMGTAAAVSYTHLDVYKRQSLCSTGKSLMKRNICRRSMRTFAGAVQFFLRTNTMTII